MASSPMQSEFGGNDVAEPPISPIHIPPPDDVPSSIPCQEASQKASKKKEPLFLSDEQQADVIDWLKDNAIIYNSKGVPQGSIFGSIVFNFFVNDFYSGYICTRLFV